MTVEEFKIKIIPYSRKLYPLVYRFLKDEEESKDALQEIMLRLWGKRFEFGKVANLDGYVSVMAKNHCLDLLKKKKPERITDESGHKILNLQSDGIDMEAKERLEHVHTIIENLPEKYREVLRMREIEGCSFDEIKNSLGLEVPNIRVVLSRARQMVKSELTKIYNYEQEIRQPAKEIL